MCWWLAVQRSYLVWLLNEIAKSISIKRTHLNVKYRWLCVFHTAYHVDSNKDVFFKEIMEGIQTILIGVAGTFETPLVFVGGNRKIDPSRVHMAQIKLGLLTKVKLRFGQLCVCVWQLEYLRGYDIEGNEKLWIVTSGNVNSLALIDVNSDGKAEVKWHNAYNKPCTQFVIIDRFHTHRSYVDVIMAPSKSTRMTPC